MFRIAESYKAGFSKQSDYEIERALDDVSLMASINRLQHSDYAAFFLEQIYKLGNDEQKRRSAKDFFTSELAKNFTSEDWQDIFKGKDLKMLNTMYNVLLKLWEDGKFK